MTSKNDLYQTDYNLHCCHDVLLRDVRAEDKHRDIYI